MSPVIFPTLEGLMAPRLEVPCLVSIILQHMDKAYHQKKYHFIQSLWGMIIGLIPCLIGAGIYAWLFC